MNDLSEAPFADPALPTQAPRLDQNLDLLAGVSVRVSVEVGSTSLRLAEILSWTEGSVVALDRAANDLLDLFVNGTQIAKGEVVMVDGRYAIRIVDVVAADQRLSPVDRRR
jgi:flagellar motor switch protein FliN